MLRRGFALLTLSMMWSCSCETTVSLKVFLRTDYQPVREFSSVKVTVAGDDRDHIAVIADRYVLPGRELALFTGLTPNDNLPITVSLRRLGGNELASTTVRIEHTKDINITIAITRDCAGVTCSSGGAIRERCLAGKCVLETCIDGSQPSCREAECDPAQNGSDCPSEIACATPTCVGGICYNDPSGQAECEAGQVCDVTLNQCVEAVCTSAIDCTDTAANECKVASCEQNSCLV